VLFEKSINLLLVEVATDRLDSFCELLTVNGSVAFIVKVFENLSDGLALVLCAVGLLTNLFKDNILELVDARSRNVVT